jgi:hypothetical protein
MNSLDPNDTINHILDKYKSPEEVKAYAKAQHKTIIKLNERLTQLERDLELTKSNRGGVATGESAVLTIAHPDGVSDEEAICIMELNRLKNVSMKGPLTLEETRKLDILVKSLYSIKNGGKKTVELQTSKMSTDDLMSAYDSMFKAVELTKA